MKVISIKVDDGLGHWLEREAKKLGRTKSDIAREALERKRNGQSGSSVHDLMQDVCGVIKGAPRDMARNTRKYLRGIGR
ncbi:MAG: ribbon-helix-helix protein, CopG family [Verrucomicrobia bacterium]|nr:ribbon-helix-helix protein, CopG family [Verrucomicrobiota bacterium]